MVNCDNHHFPVKSMNNFRVEKPLRCNQKVTLVMKQNCRISMESKLELRLNRTDSTLVESDILNPNGVEYIQLEDMDKKIPHLIRKSRKIVILTGAGISCNAGIPDFRSSDGLYNKQLNSKIKGKEMFDVSVYRSIETIEVFNKFIKEMYLNVLNSEPTITHEFIKKLKMKNKLLKCYTQNIDGLERKVGLRCDFDDKKWENSDVIQLHGDLHLLSCSSCKGKFQWNEIYNDAGSPMRKRDIQKEMELIQKRELMLGIETPPVSDESENEIEITSDNNNNNILVECPQCITDYERRLELGKRSCESNIGIIRPNIVLYGENHPYSESFAMGIQKDMGKRPNLMLIFGTSLKVPGVKGIVRKMAKKVHEEGGKVVLINRDLISNSSWKGYIDFQVVSDCDAFCQKVELVNPRMFNLNK